MPQMPTTMLAVTNLVPSAEEVTLLKKGPSGTLFDVQLVPEFVET